MKEKICHFSSEMINLFKTSNAKCIYCDNVCLPKNFTNIIFFLFKNLQFNHKRQVINKKNGTEEYKNISYFLKNFGSIHHL